MKKHNKMTFARSKDYDQTVHELSLTKVFTVCFKSRRRQRSGIHTIKRKHHIIQESKEVSSFPVGEHKAARNRQDSMTRNKNN